LEGVQLLNKGIFFTVQNLHHEGVRSMSNLGTIFSVVLHSFVWFEAHKTQSCVTPWIQRKEKIFDQNQFGDECVEDLITQDYVIIIYKSNFKKNKVMVYNHGKIKPWNQWKKCLCKILWDKKWKDVERMFLLSFQEQPNREHSKGHQAWNLPLATKLRSSLASFLLLFFKGANLDNLSLSFWTWFLIWIFEDLFLQLSLGGKEWWVLVDGGKRENRLDHSSTFEIMKWIEVDLELEILKNVHKTSRVL
jgi:hypothetical protein